MVAMDILAKLLGGYDRVKIMRYFLHAEDEAIDLDSLALKVKSKIPLVRGELNALVALGFLEKRKGKTAVPVGKDGETKIKEAVLYSLCQNFPHVDALKDLLFDFKRLDKKEIVARFKHVGRIKLFVLGGVFVDSVKSRVDILIVGEAVHVQKAEKLIDILSSELGRPLTSAIMDTEEFEYRRKMYDKFIGDIFVMDHEVVVDKLRVA
jgi:hypothetical protein